MGGSFELLLACPVRLEVLKIGANLRGVKLILAHIALGHRAMNKEARSAASPLLRFGYSDSITSLADRASDE